MADNNRNRDNYGDVGYGSDYNRGNQGSLRGGYGDNMDYGDASGGAYGGAYSSDYGAPYGSTMGSSYGNRTGANQFTPSWGRREWRDDEGSSSTWHDRGSYGGSYGSGASAGRNQYGSQWQDIGPYSEPGDYGGGYGAHRERRGEEFRNINAGRNEGRAGQGGGFRGRGPRNYTRSTERIREDVCERLTEDPAIDASDVDIRVENNEVILTGTVHSREEKRRAEDLAESIRGVTNVQNNLRVERGGTVTGG